ncbi:MAG: hypothetical protein WD669_02925 [Pirellulales bacterium]
MSSTTTTRDEFLDDRQGRTFADVVNDTAQPFSEVLEFFNDPDRQRRMEESETHHDRAPMAGVVRELESLPSINRILGAADARRSQRLRQSIGVLIRMIMERRGWRKTGKKGSLGVRSGQSRGTPNHNVGGLAFWFIRAERYVHESSKPYQSVRRRCKQLESSTTNGKAGARRTASNGRPAKPASADHRRITRKKSDAK